MALFLTVLAPLLLLGCAARGQADGEPEPSRPAPLPLLESEGYLGVIFPAVRTAPLEFFGRPPAKTRWTPSHQDIADLEAALPRFLSDLEAAGDDWTAQQVGHVRARLGEYRRQYVGVVRNGEESLFVNFFPPASSGDPDWFGSWRRELIIVDDGGAWFWQVDYTPATGRFSGFAVNGDA